MTPTIGDLALEWFNLAQEVARHQREIQRLQQRAQELEQQILRLKNTPPNQAD